MSTYFLVDTWLMSVGEEKSGGGGGGSVGRRRRRWSEAQKRQIVAETHEPGVSVPMVAQRYNLNANQIFGWRRLFREPERTAGAGRYVPVVVRAAPGPAEPVNDFEGSVAKSGWLVTCLRDLERGVEA